MKKRLVYLILFFVMVITLAGCGGNKEVESALSGTKWFTDGGEANIESIYVASLSLEKNNEVSYKVYEIDGNGINCINDISGKYRADDTNVTVSLKGEDLEGKTELVFPYVIDGDNVKLDDCCSPDEVEDAIQGYWRERSLEDTMNCGHEYNFHIKDGKIKFEHAAEAYGYTNGEFYYYGPYVGTYSIGDGEIVCKDADKEPNLYFTVKNGRVVLLRYTHILEEAKKLPGEKGYSF